MLTLLEKGEGLKDLFLCKCGNQKWINKQNVKRGLQISCGCYGRIASRKAQIEKAFLRNTKKYDDYIELELTNGEYVKLDYDDYEKIKEYSWYKSKRLSVESRINYKLVKLHRLIMNAPTGKVVDHINGNTLDNRKENLRLCNHTENTRNSKKPKNGITSIYKGVHFEKTRGKYIACIARKRIGEFSSEREAGLAYNEKAKEIFGEFARLNIIN